MQIGIICEGGDVSKVRNSTTDNPDARVIERFINLIAPGHKFEFVPLRDKPNLKAQCGNATKLLLTVARCNAVIICWDLYPATWGIIAERQARPCRAEDRAAILESLERAGVTHPHVYLLCVEAELETLLLSDERALSEVLSTETKPIALTKSKRDGGVNPKKALAKLFSTHKKKYNPAIHNPLIAKAIPDTVRLKRNESFSRLIEKLRLLGTV